MSEEEYEEEYEEGYEEDEDSEAAAPRAYGDDSLSSALARQWGAAPWYISSLGLHLLIFALLLLFAPEPRPPKAPAVKVVGDIVEEVEEIKPDELPEPEELPEEVVTEDVNVNVETTVNVETNIDFSADIPVEENNDSPDDSTEFAEISDDMAPATMGMTAIAAGGSGRSKGKFANRTGKNKSRVSKKAGATKAGQDALERGLRWLAKNQESDGHWSCSKHGGGNNDIAVTAMAQLAFLGAGHSTKYGKYRKNVRAAEKYLLSKYKEKPGIIGSYRYEAAITMMAVAESWAMSEDRNLEGVVQSLVDYAVSQQSTNGGWGYSPFKDPVKAHVDSSVAGWWMMGLKSAKVAGANIPDKNWDSATSYFKSVTKKVGDGVYGSGYTGPGATLNLTAVGLTCLQFLGLSRDDPLVKGQAEFFMAPGKMINSKFKGGNPYYGWYYQALGLYQMGTRSVYWKKFAPVMQKVLVDIQVSSGINKGAWPTKLPWAEEEGHFEKAVGMVGTTSIGCLMLEVFYRYDDAHKSH